jgi:hypothetical protein
MSNGRAKYMGPFGTGHMLPQVYVPEWMLRKLEVETEKRRSKGSVNFSKSDLIREIIASGLQALGPHEEEEEEEPASRRVPTTQPPPFA